MTPRADEFENDNLSTSDDDEEHDEGLKEDMAALARACMLRVPKPGGAENNTAVRYDGETNAAVGCNGDRDDGADVAPTSDPLLDAGDAIVPVTTDSDDDQDLEYLDKVNSLYKPLASVPPPLLLPTASDSDDDLDLKMVRAIFNRFSYDDGNKGCRVGRVETFDDENQTSSPSCEGDIANGSVHYKSDGGELCPVSQNPKDGVSDAKASILPHKKSCFPPSAQAFIDAINKNRSFQRFLRGKLIEIEAKIEESKQLRNKIKILKDFQLSCIRRTGNVLSLKKDPRVQLISAKKSSAPKSSKSLKKVSAKRYGPEENSRVSIYKMVLERFPLSLDRKRWSNVERENLSKGIKQQFQEMMLQISVDRISSECLTGDANDMDSICASVKDLEITPERIREFSPKVNWDQLASMYVAGRTGAECESRWLNCEDSLINQGAWTSDEDRSLLLIVQNMGIRNWFDIAVSLATNRTPFQCLARFQRSLNPSMLNSEWTEEEDAQLCSAVAYFGESNWQSVASVLERRTGTQCSNRWKKSLCPERKGSFTQEEDIRLTVAVMLFGRKWNQIAKFVPGRIQSQCRDRYLNSLDPSLKWGGWTEEEDLKLEAAIAKHGFCWSKVAEEVPPRTDSQCRKRWKVICPEQVPLLQEARKKQKSILASNFVDRESERPTITLNDFLPLRMLASKSDDTLKLCKKRKRKSRKRSQRGAKKSQLGTEEVQDTRVHSDAGVKTCGGNVPGSNVPKKMRSKKHAKRAQMCPDEVEDAVCSGEVPSSNVPKKMRPKRHAKWAEMYPNEVEDAVSNGGEAPSSNVPKKMRPKRHAKRAEMCPDEVEDAVCNGGEVPSSNVPKKMRPKRHAKGAPMCPNEVEDAICSDKGKTCIESSESKSTSIEGSENQDWDDITLVSFLRNKSNKRLSKFTKNLSQASLYSRTTIVSKQFENQIPSGSTLSCGTSGTKDFFIQQSASSDGQVGKPEDAIMLMSKEDNMTLVSLVGSKGKKRSKAAKGRGAHSSKLKKGSELQSEERCASKPSIISDDSGPSKHVEEETVLHGVAEQANLNVEEKDDDLLSSFLQNRSKRKRKRPSRYL